MEEPEKWDELLGALIEICKPLLDRMSIVPIEHVPVRIIDAMFLKSVDTLRAVRLLYSSGLAVQAQALIRILLEARIDIEVFMRDCATDHTAAVRKVLDATMMQKISQQRQSNFIGLSSVPGAPSRARLIEDERALIGQYGKDTAKKMSRFGFSGLSIEDRAREVGLSAEYNIVYRNFSRNVHNTDYMEHLADRGAIDKQLWHHYQDIRDNTALTTAIACVWRAAWFVDSMLEPTYCDALSRYWLRCLSFRRWVREVGENIGTGKLPS